MLHLELGKTIRSASPTMERAVLPWWPLAGFVALVIAAGIFRSWMFSPVPAQRISFDQTHSINLLRSGNCMTGFHLLYAIDNDRRSKPVSLPDCCACFGINYDSLQTQDGQIVAVVDHASPRRVLVLHDFSENESWPAENHSTKSDEIGKRLLARVQDANPDTDLILMPGR
jgi:hypothetical protein